MCHKRIIDIAVVSKKLFYVALDGTVYIYICSGRANKDPYIFFGKITKAKSLQVLWHQKEKKSNPN